MYQDKDIAIVILNWNGKQLLEQFLPSVVKHSGNAKVYLIDNASQDDSVIFVQKTYPSVALIKNNDNSGFAGGYNKGMKSVKEPILCLLNNDVEVTENWLEPILQCFNKDRNVAIVQPKILDYKNKEQFEYAGAAGGFIDKYGYPFCRGRLFDDVEKDHGQYNDVEEIFWASGACFFIKNQIFKQLEGFDTSFFAHMEEIDLCWRAYNRGIKIIYNGHSTVYHLGGATLSKSNPRKTYLNFRNSLFTLTKNTDSHLIGRIFIRLTLDGVAALRFLFQLKIGHFVAILKAHWGLYLNFKRLLKQRKQLSKRKDYFKIKSIVWSYFVLGKSSYPEL